jgi:hypothetical protein
MLEFLDTLPPGPRAFVTWEEYEQHLRKEQDAWDRRPWRRAAWLYLDANPIPQLQ